MLSKKRELELRAGRQQLEGTLAGWCGLSASIPSPQRAACRPRSPKPKISIKQYRMKQGHKHSKSQPLKFLTQSSRVGVPLTPKENARAENKVNFTFSYGLKCSQLQKYSTQPRLPNLSVKSISLPEEHNQNVFKSTPQYGKLSRHASACLINQQNELSKSEQPQGLVVQELSKEEELLQGLWGVEQTSMLAHPDGEDDYWQGSTTNKGASEGRKGLEDYRFFSRPQIRNFQRGDLFHAVKRSQTIKNDYQSESQTSQVLQDYKSLMSKIQQNGVEEQFQQI